MRLALPFDMVVLEARFHPPRSGEDEFIVVAHVVWEKDVDSGLPSIQPVRSLWALGAPATMLSKLQFLAVNSAPETFARLERLKSEGWSFVDVTSR
jgi:hypothetical protein